MDQPEIVDDRMTNRKGETPNISYPHQVTNRGSNVETLNSRDSPGVSLRGSKLEILNSRDLHEIYNVGSIVETLNSRDSCDVSIRENEAEILNSRDSHEVSNRGRKVETLNSTSRDSRKVSNRGSRGETWKSRDSCKVSNRGSTGETLKSRDSCKVSNGGSMGETLNSRDIHEVSNMRSKSYNFPKTSLKGSKRDYMAMLEELGREHKFVVTCVEVEEKCDVDSTQTQCILQLSTFPVTVCHIVGTDKIAHNEAAKRTLKYLEIVTKLSIQGKGWGNVRVEKGIMVHPPTAGQVDREHLVISHEEVIPDNSTPPVHLGQGCVSTPGHSSRQENSGGEGPMFPPHVRGPRICNR